MSKLFQSSQLLTVSKLSKVSKISKFSTNPPLLTTSRIPPLLHLSNEEKALVEKVKTFAQKEVKPLLKEMDKTGNVDEGLIEEIFKLKLMGLEAPSQYGGSNGSFFDILITIEELSKVDPGFAVNVHLQNAIVIPMLMNYATKEQKEKYLGRVCKDTIGAFALSETSSGSDAFSMKTVAKKDGDDFLISGSKWGITHAPLAEFFMVFANAEPEKGYKGVTCFLVDAKENGVIVGEKEDTLGMRAAGVASVHFDNVRVHKSAILGEYGQGYKYAIEVLNASRILIGAQMVGLAQGCFDETIPYLRDRKQFGQRLIDFQGIQHQVAKIRTEIEAARLLTYNSGRIKDYGVPFVKEASMTKYYAPEVACKTTKTCIELLGGVGFTKNYGAEKFYRDAVVGGIYEGTANIQLNTIAKIVDNEYKK